MSEPEHRKSRAATWTLSVVALLLLYVLSIGPLAYCSEKGWLGYPSPMVRANLLKPAICGKSMAYYDFEFLDDGPRFFKGLYEPLKRLLMRSRRDLLLEYIAWWRRMA